MRRKDGSKHQVYTLQSSPSVCIREREKKGLIPYMTYRAEPRTVALTLTYWPPGSSEIMIFTLNTLGITYPGFYLFG